MLIPGGPVHINFLVPGEVYTFEVLDQIPQLHHEMLSIPLSPTTAHGDVTWTQVNVQTVAGLPWTIFWERPEIKLPEAQLPNSPNAGPLLICSFGKT